MKNVQHLVLLVRLSVFTSVLIGFGAQSCRAQSANADDAQLRRMKTYYREWISTSPNRDLLVEFDPAPDALGVPDPRFSWVAPLEGRGRTQTAYRLQVASRPELLELNQPDMWDSGLVSSSLSTNVYYAGRPFESDTQYFWRVQVRDEMDNIHPYSRTAQFHTALLKDSDWKAQWIGRGDPHEVVADVDKFLTHALPPDVQQTVPDLRSPMFRKDFAVGDSVQHASLFVSGMGVYEVSLNGKKVGNRGLTPAKTDYRKRVLYDVFDVTAELQKGDNSLGILLGTGWYNAQNKWWGWQMQWYGSPRVILQLEIRYTDGSTSRVVTDGTWKSCMGPITFSCIYDGEDYDARLEQPRWDVPGFDARRWEPVNLVASPGGKLAPAMLQADCVTEIVRPIAITEPKAGVYVYDMGRNFTGWVRLRVQGPRGTAVKLRFAEAAKPDGSLDRTTVMQARSV